MTVNHEIALSILAAVGILLLLTVIAAVLMIAMAWQDFQRAAANRDEPKPPRTGFDFIKLALALRCPSCGRGPISRSLWQMNQRCPHCGVTFWTNEGEWIGPAVINYTAALAGALATWAVLVMFDCSAAAQIILPSIAAIVAGLGVVPWSRSFWTLFLYLNGEIGHERGQ